MAALQRLLLEEAQFAETHIDLVRPLCEDNGHNHVLTILCPRSSQVEAIPLSDISMAMYNNKLGLCLILCLASYRSEREEPLKIS